MSLERNSAAMSSKSSVSMTGVYFLVLLLLEGLQRVSGVFFLETKYSLGSNRLLAVIPFALSRATSCFVGVISNHWKRKFKPGTWVIIGSLISAAGLAFCFMTTDIFWWSVHWGIIFGSGLGIASPSLIQELKKQRSKTIKSALKLSSSSFGCVIFPFIVCILIAHYGLNGCYIIFAGLILNCTPLNFIAIYRIRFRLPKPKWRLRKKNKRYQTSAKNALENKISQTSSIQILSKESFICSLEPDRLQKVSNNGKQCRNDKKTTDCIDIFKPIVEAKNNMEAEDVNKDNSTGFKKGGYSQDNLSDLGAEIKNYEINRTGFEDSFSHSDALSESPVDSSLRNEFLNSFAKTSQKQTLSGSEVSDSEINTSSEKDHSTQPQFKNEDNNTLKNRPIKPLRLNIPIEIKVHVVECTVTTSEEYLETPPIDILPPSKPNGYRRHSNSLMSGCYDNIDFTKMFHHKNSNASPLHKLECHLTSKMFLISEDSESDSGSRNSAAEVDGPPTKSKSSILKNLFRLSKPSCLVIVYTSVIFEFTLALMLTIFADFARDNGGGTFWDSNFVLVGFGFGGIVGHLSFSFWGNRLLVDGSHAATAVILLLNGLTVAGILWSTNVCWLSGFFGVLGFIESGILLTLPKLISDYIDKKSTKVLSMTCRSFSGVAMLCLPCVIGFSRDEIGEYDGLLQVTSCLSVLCAVLCYFLPRFTKQLEPCQHQVA